MPHFYFELVVDEEFKDQGGMTSKILKSLSRKPIPSQASFISFVRSCVRGVAPFASPMARTRNSIAPRLILSPRGPRHAAARDTICLRGANGRKGDQSKRLVATSFVETMLDQGGFSLAHRRPLRLDDLEHARKFVHQRYQFG